MIVYIVLFFIGFIASIPWGWAGFFIAPTVTFVVGFIAYKIWSYFEGQSIQKQENLSFDAAPYGVTSTGPRWSNSPHAPTRAARQRVAAYAPDPVFIPSSPVVTDDSDLAFVAVSVAVDVAEDLVVQDQFQGGGGSFGGGGAQADWADTTPVPEPTNDPAPDPTPSYDSTPDTGSSYDSGSSSYDSGSSSDSSSSSGGDF